MEQDVEEGKLVGSMYGVLENPDKTGNPGLQKAATQ